MKLLILLIQAGACVSMAAFLAGCTKQCKVEPPPGVIGTNKEISAKAAANALNTAISGGELSGHYQNTVNNTYQTVGQDDIAFYLLLQAYNCESARGNALALLKFCALPVKSLPVDTTRRHRRRALPRRPRS